MAVADVDSHPPLDLDLVGIADWRGSKWVSFFQGELGRPVWSVHLDHAIDNILVRVETAPRAYWNEVMLGRLAVSDTNRGALNFAVGTLARLADVARPPLEAAQRDHYNQRIWPFARREARSWTNWEAANWQLGVRSLDARVFRFAHAWTGLSVDDHDRYIGAVSRGVRNFSVSQ
jgi:hypothetical protein